MRTLDSIEIKAPLEKTFSISQDYSCRLKWDPFLSSAKLIGAEPNVGAQAECISKFGVGMLVEYVSFKPPKVAAVKMVRGPIFLKSFAASWNFESMESNLSKVTFCYNFELASYFKIFEYLCHLFFANEMRMRLKSLKTFCEIES